MSPEQGFNPHKAAEAYLPLMHELVIRTDLVAQACDGRLGLSPPFAREFSYLQFRRICELIALGCLYLHGDLPIAQGSALKKEWNAEKIMKLLRTNYPSAFPQSAIFTQSNEGSSVECNCKADALSYREFVQLSNECGAVLHRGTIRTVHSTSFCSEEDYEKVLTWQLKIVRLMEQHVITRANQKGYYLTSIRTLSGYPECSVIDLIGADGIAVHTVKMIVGDDVMHSYVSNKRK